MTAPARRWISTTEAGRVLGVCGERVRQLVADGVIDSVVVGGRHVLDEDQVQRLAGARESLKRDSAFSRLVAAERRRGRAASAKVDRSLALGPLGMSVAELRETKPSVDLSPISAPAREPAREPMIPHKAAARRLGVKSGWLSDARRAGNIVGEHRPRAGWWYTTREIARLERALDQQPIAGRRAR